MTENSKNKLILKGNIIAYDVVIKAKKLSVSAADVEATNREVSRKVLQII